MDKYPDDVAGVIFVDASPPDLIERLPKKLQKKMQPKPSPLWLTKALFKLGIIRLLINKMLKKTDKEQLFSKDNQEINVYLENSILAANDEMAGLGTMLDKVKNIKSFGDIPLTILAATKAEKKIKGHEEIVKIFNTISEENLAMSSNSKIVWADCGHYIPLEKPQLVIEEIKEMLKNKG